MTNRRNFLAGVLSAGWTALAGLIAVPFYIHYLGLDAYGLIGVFLTLQNVFLMLDLGLSPTVSREVARSLASGTMPRARSLVYSMSLIFMISGGLIALLLFLLAPALATSWLNSDKLPQTDVTKALALMGLTIGARWPGILYIGVLNGARRVDLASAITIASTSLASLGAIAVLAFVQPTLQAFFVWQALIGLVHSFAMGAAVRYVMGPTARRRFDREAVVSIWRFSAGMAGVAVTGILFSQIDKIALTKTSGLDDVGRYTIATALAGMLYRLVMPAFNVVYPQFSGLFEKGDLGALRAEYRRSSRQFLTVIFPAAMMLIVCAPSILSLWIGDQAIVARTQLLVILLASGTAIHCIMYFPYALQIACGDTKLPLLINLLLSIVFMPTVLFLSSRYGATGAAVAWVILHTLYFALGTVLTARYVPGAEGVPWVVHSVAPPLAISLIFGLAAAVLIQTASSDLARLLIGSLCAAGALLAGGSTLPEGRAVLRRVTAGLTRG